MATLVVLTVITLFGAVGAGGWQDVVYPDPANTAVTSDSPLPMAVSHVVSRENPLFVALTGIGLIGLVASFHGILIAASRAMLELGRVGYLPKRLALARPRLRRDPGRQHPRVRPAGAAGPARHLPDLTGWQNVTW